MRKLALQPQVLFIGWSQAPQSSVVQSTAKLGASVTGCQLEQLKDGAVMRTTGPN